MADTYEEILYGQILPIEGDDGSDEGIILLVEGEEEFVIELDKTGRKLCDHLDKWIRAEGIVKETPRELRFKIRSYTFEDDLDYDSDDDW